MLYFNGQFVSNTDAVYVGSGFPIYTAVAKLDKDRAVGTAVKLNKGTLSPFEFVTGDAGTADANGILMFDVAYGEEGNLLKDKIVKVVTKGMVCVKVNADMSGAKIGDKVYCDDGADFKHTAGAQVVGKVASNVFKARQLGSDELVDAIYLDFEVGAK